MRIKDRAITEGHPTYIIAELSANHNNDLDLAKRTIDAIKETGADAVKTQTFTPDSITLDSDREIFKTRKDSLWAGERLYNLYKKAAMPNEWQGQLKAYAEGLGLDFFSSPFDHAAVDLLEDLDVPAYKIASLEITDTPLIEYVASKQKPIIISTGIASLKDIELAVNTCRKVGNNQIALLKCTSAYPTPLSEVNLKNIPLLQDTFGVVSGLSDHTMSTTVPVAAVALGARIIEKHIILDRSLGGVDSAFSLDKDEFKEMVEAVRNTEEALGSSSYVQTEKMKKASISARSLIVVQDMEPGQPFTPENLKSLRPGYGLHPSHLANILGKECRVAIERGTPLSWDLIA